MLADRGVVEEEEGRRGLGVRMTLADKDEVGEERIEEER